MSVRVGHWLAGVIVALLAGTGVSFAQDPPPTTPPAQTPPAGQTAEPQRGKRGEARAMTRPNLPAPGGNLTQQQLLDYLDVATLIQAERALQITTDQYPNFVARLRKLQVTRRQYNQQRMRMLREMGALVQGPGPFKDEVVAEKLKALDDLSQKAGQDVRQAEAELDGVLVPWQRAKFRLVEERIEQMKLDLLMKLRPQPGAAGK